MPFPARITRMPKIVFHAKVHPNSHSQYQLPIYPSNPSCLPFSSQKCKYSHIIAFPSSNSDELPPDPKTFAHFGEPFLLANRVKLNKTGKWATFANPSFTGSFPIWPHFLRFSGQQITESLPFVSYL